MITEIKGGVDQHAAACVDLMELPLTKENRTDAKIFNFRMIYGGSPFSFYKDPKMPNFSLKKWETIVNNFYAKYTGLKKWHDRLMVEVRRNKGYLINPTGRKLAFKKKKKKGVWDYHRPNVLNYPVQSLAADIIHICMVEARNQVKEACPNTKFLMQVHDSLIFDSPKKEVDTAARICYNIFIDLPHYIESYFGFKWNVPLTGECEVGETWGTTKAVEL